MALCSSMPLWEAREMSCRGKSTMGYTWEETNRAPHFLSQCIPHGAMEGARGIDRRGGPEDGGKGSKATQQTEETSLDIIYHLMGSESLGHKGVQRAYTSTCTSCYPEHHFCGPTLCWALC